MDSHSARSVANGCPGCHFFLSNSCQFRLILFFDMSQASLDMSEVLGGRLPPLWSAESPELFLVVLQLQPPPPQTLETVAAAGVSSGAMAGGGDAVTDTAVGNGGGGGGGGSRPSSSVPTVFESFQVRVVVMLGKCT